MSAVVTRTGHRKAPRQNAGSLSGRLRQVKRWLLGQPAPDAQRPSRGPDPTVALASLIDDGERRDRQIIALREEAFGPDHPDVASALHILAARYHLVRRYDEAETLYNRALEIRSETLGHDHPSTVEVLEDLGDLWRDRGNEFRARSAYDLALMAVTEPDHRKRKRDDYAARIARIDRPSEVQPQERAQ